MTDSVKVAVRVRPFNQREKDRNAKCIIKMDGQSTTIINPETDEPKAFAFDFSYWSHDGCETDANGYSVPIDGKYASQRRVYEDLGVTVLENAWNGYNAALFAYGQTGSGKSYSMVGYGANKGIIPISCEEMFKRIESNDDPKRSYQVTVSMLEIYNEKIRDLLNSKSNPPGGLKIREDKNMGTYVDGLSAVAVRNYIDIEKQMEAGTTNRTVASTNMNATSSRAHTVFTIHFKIITETPLGKSEVASKINLVDLAGSERAESTGATGDRLKEGCAINQSLSALGNVISALAEVSGGKKNAFVPYRNSVLTRLLQDALGGNSKTIMIAALSPADINYEETLSTLRYADRAKRIKNSATKNENPTEKLIRELKEENERLKKMLGGGVPVADATSAGTGGLDPAEVDRVKREYEDKLKENERLMQEQAKSWEQKLAEAQTLMAQNDNGVSKAQIDEERKTLPHLVNLNEDPLMSDCLVHILKPGPTRVGRKDAKPTPNIPLSGVSIQTEHAVIDSTDGKVVITPEEGAKTFVNGKLITEKTELLQGYRVIFGTNHVYRFNDPIVAAKIRAEKEAKGEMPDVVDWETAMRELAEAQGFGVSLSQKAKEMEAEEEARKKEYEEKLKKLEAEMKRQQEEVHQEAARREAQLQENLKKMAEKDQEAARQVFFEKQKELEAKAKALEEELKRQQGLKQDMEEGAAKRKREMNLLEDMLGRLIPEVNEVNTISEEMQRSITFELKLVDTIPEAPNLSPLEELRQLKKVDIEVKVTNSVSKAVWMWNLEKFDNRLHIIREIYNQYLDNGPTAIPKDQDPFWDPPEDTVIGRAHIYLEPLSYLFDIGDTTPIVDYKGKKEGSLRVELFACDPDGRKLAELDDPANDVEDPSELIGRRLDFVISIPRAAGLPVHYNNNLHIEYRFYTDEEPYLTEAFPSKTSSPEFKYQKHFVVNPVTADFLNYLKTDAITFKVVGQPDPTEPTYTVQPKAGSVAAFKSLALAETQALKEQLEAMKLEKESLERNRDATEASLRTEVETLRKELMRARSSGGGGGGDPQAAEEALAMKKENAALKAEHASALKKKDEELASLRTMVESLRSRPSSQLASPDAKRAEADAAARSSPGAPSEVDKLKLEAEMKKAELEAARAEAERHRAEVAVAKAEAERRKAEMEVMKAEAERKKAELGELKAEADRKKVELEIQRNTSGKSKEELEAAKADADKRKAEAVERKKAAEEAKVAAEKRKGEAEKLKADAEKQKKDAEEMKVRAEKRKLVAKSKKWDGVEMPSSPVGLARTGTQLRAAPAT